MNIKINPKLEAKLRKCAESAGLTVAAYLERLIRADQSAEEELESLALEGLNSGNSISVSPGYWEAKHRQLDERLRESR